MQRKFTVALLATTAMVNAVELLATSKDNDQGTTNAMQAA